MTRKAQSTISIEEINEEDHLKEETKSAHDEDTTSKEDDPLCDTTFDPKTGNVKI